jgi:low affinity Fe/Cu permease
MDLLCHGTPLVLLWALSGPLFGFSVVWPLLINTATTVMTFLMVFLIQNTHLLKGLAAMGGQLA